MTEYQDSQTVLMVRDIKKIAYNYIFRSTFFIDCFACFPFIYVCPWEYEQDLLLIKMLRLYKLQVDFIEIDQILSFFKMCSKDKATKDSKKKNKSSKSHIIQYDNMLKHILKISGLVINTCVITYVLGCFWYRMSDRIKLGDDEDTFITKFFEKKGTDSYISREEIPDFEKLIFSCYFILTTLSTVGYGDFFPVSILEKIVGSLIMFCGLTFFSILMNEFVSIILELKGDNQTDDERKLNKWMLLLRRFHNGGKALSKELRDDIMKNFMYFWANNRTATLLEKKDYFDSLPRDIKRKLMKDYLYEDIFRHNGPFSDFFDNGEAMDPDFLYDVSFGLQPRQFWPTEKDSFIYEPQEYITEMYFVTKGKWFLGSEILQSKQEEAHTTIP